MKLLSYVFLLLSIFANYENFTLIAQGSFLAKNQPNEQVHRCGMKNNGNSCYFNATVQCLTMCLPSDLTSPDPIIKKLQKVQQRLSSKQPGENINAEDLLTDVIKASQTKTNKKQQLHEGQQEDARELLSILLEKIRESECSLFDAPIKSITKSSYCNHTWESPCQMESLLSLGIKKDKTNQTLDDCLKNYFTQEQITNFTCDICKNQHINGTRQPRIDTLPQVLILQLNRFEHAIINEEFVQNKINTPVSFSVEALSIPTSQQKYALKGMILHSGSLSGGHYIAYVNDHDQWFKCDDASVVNVNKVSIEKLASTGKDGDFTPYLLFYEKTEKKSGTLPKKDSEQKSKVTKKSNAQTELIVKQNVLNQDLSNKEFYDKRCTKYVPLLKQEAQLYYKKIQPKITSKPKKGNNEWSSPTIISLGKKIPPNKGTYHLKDISFKINDLEKFDPTKDVTISATCNGEMSEVQCFKFVETKELYLPRFENYGDLFLKGFTENAYWRQKIVLKAPLRDSNNEIHEITIEYQKGQNNPVMVQGIAVVFNKDTEKTKIFFDFVDVTGQSLDYFQPIATCNHKKSNVDKVVFCIRQHQLFEHSTKDIFGFFDSSEIRKRWIPDETGFYDQAAQSVLTCLPSCYKDPNKSPETPVEPLVWIFGEDTEHDSFYEFDDNKVLKKTNNYIYSTGNGLFATSLYKETAKEYLSKKNTIEFRYLLQETKPQLSMHKDVVVKGGHQPWLAGIYQKTQRNKKILWRRIEGPENEIEYISKKTFSKHGLNCGLVPHWPCDQEEDIAEESKQFCDASQRNFPHFPAKINNINKDVLKGFKKWTKLTSLDLSGVQIDNKSITMSDLLEEVSSMKQLKCLNFSNNNSVTDFDEDYEEMADGATTLFFALSRCLDKLKNLEELHIQGLWLQPHTELGKGVEKDGEEPGEGSSQVAKLTSIINHTNKETKRNDRRSVYAIIDSISKLPKLKKLSIDGIPRWGFSYAARHDGWSCLWRKATPFSGTIIDADNQDKFLKNLVAVSATQLTKMPMLETLHVYSPGGNCVNYYSKAFREKIKSSKPAHSKLTVKAKTL